MKRIEDQNAFLRMRAWLGLPLLLLAAVVFTSGSTAAQPASFETISVKTGSFVLLPGSQAILNIVDTKNLGPDSEVVLLLRDDQNRVVGRTTGVIGRGRTLSLVVPYEDLVATSGETADRILSVRGIAIIQSMGDSESDHYVVGIQVANTANGWLTAGASCPVRGPLDPGLEDEPVADCGPCHVTRTPSDIK